MSWSGSRNGGTNLASGVVTRVVADFFDVVDNGLMRRCRSRGMVKRLWGGILVGDRVEYMPLGTNEGIVEKIYERKTQLIRPPIANVDQALLVFSLVSPDFHFRLVDKVLVSVMHAGLEAVIAITKCDLADEQAFHTVAEPYRKAGFVVIRLATKQAEGIADVHRALAGKVSVFAGPSGAGKSTLANAIVPGLGQKMGEISAKLGRGKHTTRHVELFALTSDTFIADTPGFSQMNVDLPPAQLRLWYPEFQPDAEHCLYRGCLHYQEVDCGVKSAVASGDVAQERYDSYRELLSELMEQEERRY